MMQGKSITFVKTDRHHAGVYECKAENSEGEPSKASINLQITCKASVWQLVCGCCSSSLTVVLLLEEADILRAQRMLALDSTSCALQCCSPASGFSGLSGFFFLRLRLRLMDKNNFRPMRPCSQRRSPDGVGRCTNEIHRLRIHEKECRLFI